MLSNHVSNSTNNLRILRILRAWQAHNKAIGTDETSTFHKPKSLFPETLCLINNTFFRCRFHGSIAALGFKMELKYEETIIPFANNFVHYFTVAM